MAIYVNWDTLVATPQTGILLPRKSTVFEFGPCDKKGGLTSAC